MQGLRRDLERDGVKETLDQKGLSIQDSKKYIWYKVNWNYMIYGRIEELLTSGIFTTVNQLGQKILNLVEAKLWEAWDSMSISTKQTEKIKRKN